MAPVRKAIELAKAGDTQMLKFLLDRILPKERSVRVELPAMEYAYDAVDALGAIIDAVGTGRIAPSEAAALANLVAVYARTIDVADLESRLETIEKDLKDLKRILKILRSRNGSKFSATNFENRASPLCRAEGTRRTSRPIGKRILLPSFASRDCYSCNRLVRTTKDR
jgi:hypothetical protein